MITAILAADPPPASALQATSPPALNHLVKTCLAKDPEDRRFVRELAQVRQGLGLERIHLFGHSWGAMLAVDYLLSGAWAASLILASPALSIPRWMADAAQLRKTLPADVQETLGRHEAAGTTDTAISRRDDAVLPPLLMPHGFLARAYEPVA